MLEMPFEDAYDLLEYAIETSIEERMMERWINGPQMYMSYSEFREQIEISKAKVNQNEDIIKEKMAELAQLFG